MSTLKYTELKEKLSKLFAPASLEIAENFKFNSRKQQVGESIQEFATSLQNISKKCDFAAHLPKALRNQFVFGIYDKKNSIKVIGYRKSYF